MIVDIENPVEKPIRSYIGDDLVWQDFVFTPVDLFANGEQGVWFDPSDLSTMYQNATGTTPVTKDGDPVALIKDKSGNNNHATQPTASARPIYRTDGELHWLEFDGVDDFLDTSLVPFNGSSFFQSSAVAVTGGKQFLGTFRFLREGGDPTATSDSYLEEYMSKGTPNDKKVVVQRYPRLVTIYNENDSMPDRNTNLISWHSNSAESFKTQVIPSQPSLIDVGVKNLSSGNATLSLFRGYKGDQMAGRMYGFIWVSDNVSDEKRDGTNNYLLLNSGVML